jgi:hypothetical protein
MKVGGGALGPVSQNCTSNSLNSSRVVKLSQTLSNPCSQKNELNNPDVCTYMRIYWVIKSCCRTQNVPLGQGCVFIMVSLWEFLLYLHAHMGVGVGLAHALLVDDRAGPPLFTFFVLRCTVLWERCATKRPRNVEKHLFVTPLTRFWCVRSEY